jgi:hypothetical protein
MGSNPIIGTSEKQFYEGELIRSRRMLIAKGLATNRNETKFICQLFAKRSFKTLCRGQIGQFPVLQRRIAVACSALRFPTCDFCAEE